MDENILYLSHKQAIHIVTYLDPTLFEYNLFVGDEKHPYIVDCISEFNHKVIISMLKEIV